MEPNVARSLTNELNASAAESNVNNSKKRKLSVASDGIYKNGNHGLTKTHKTGYFGDTCIEAPSGPVRYHCDYCRKDISKTPRIQCAICKPDFDLCIQCFCVGVEIKGHKHWHDYRIIENLHVPFITTDWGADEELLLLEGLELFGIGNWSDVSDHVSTKDMNACRQHFNEIYLRAPQWPDVQFTMLSDRNTVKLLNSGKYCRPYVPRTVKPIVREKPPKGKPPAALTSRSLSGYIPMREEFEVEWENETEAIISELEFNESDDDEEIQNKYCLLEAYNYRLKQREEMRNLIVSHRLHEPKYQKSLEKNRNPNEKLIYNKIKNLLQIMTTEEHQEIVSGIAKEEFLKKRIEDLQEFRINGITTFSEANCYLLEKAKRLKTGHPSNYPFKPIYSIETPSTPNQTSTPVTPSSTPINNTPLKRRLLISTSLDRSLTESQNDSPTPRVNDSPVSVTPISSSSSDTLIEVKVESKRTISIKTRFSSKLSLGSSTSASLTSSNGVSTGN